MNINSTMRDISAEVSRKSAESMEKMIEEQLGILISEGILVVERTEPIITIDDKNILKVEHKARLLLKDHEYIQKLHDKIAVLEDNVRYWKDVALRMRGAAKAVLSEDLEDEH